MTPAERLSFLVDALENGSAIDFSRKTGIAPACLSRARHGKSKAETYFPRILMIYPDVNPRWLLDDEGIPLKSMGKEGAIMARLTKLEKEVKRLAGLLDSAKNSAKNFEK